MNIKLIGYLFLIVPIISVPLAWLMAKGSSYFNFESFNSLKIIGVSIYVLSIFTGVWLVMK